MTLEEVLQQLEEYRYELRVWTFIEDRLCPYLDQDNHRRAETTLKVKGCSEPFVPTEVFESIIETIRAEKIEPITKKIESIVTLEVEEQDEEVEEPSAKKVRKKKTVRKEGGLRKRKKGPRVVADGS